MMQRTKSSSSSSSSSSVPNQHFNPSHIRYPLPFSGNRVGALPPIPATLPPKHSRSISQPSSLEGTGFNPFPPPSPFTMYHSTSMMVAGGGENLPPPGTSHRRSNSVDVPFGFSSMMPPLIPSRSLERSISDGGGGEVSGWSHLVKEEPIFMGGTSESESIDDMLRAYMNLDAEEEEMESSRGTRRKTTNGGGSSTDSEGESHLKRRAGGDIAPTSRHYRSVSMDSCFRGEGGYRVGYGNCEFSADEMKRISADEKLAAIVMVDPKRVKRTLSNRVSAARSKERKMQYTAALEHKVHALLSETNTLSAQLTHLRRDSMGLQNQNCELRFRLQAMEQQAQLRYALSEKLSQEVQRLRLMIGEPSSSESNISKTTLNPEMFEQQLRISQLQHQQFNENSTMIANHASNGYYNQLCDDPQFRHI